MLRRSLIVERKADELLCRLEYKIGCEVSDASVCCYRRHTVRV